MNMNNFYKDGLQFECARCGHCCRHEPGYVFLSENDINQATDYLSVDREDFLKKYCRIVDIGFFRRVSFIEKPNNDCIFWQDGMGCSIYEARPLQCRSYPFWPSIMESGESWQEESKSCPGMNRGRTHSEKEIRKWLEKRENDPPFQPDS